MCLFFVTSLEPRDLLCSTITQRKFSFLKMWYFMSQYFLSRSLPNSLMFHSQISWNIHDI